MQVLLWSPTDVDNSTAVSLDVGFGLRHVVREHRKRLRLTQDKLAERAGTTGETISRIERGVVEPSPDTLRALAPVFGVPVRELLSLLDPDVIHYAGHGPAPIDGGASVDRDTDEGGTPGDRPLIPVTFAEYVQRGVELTGSQTALEARLGLHASRSGRELVAAGDAFDLSSCLQLAELLGESPTDVLRAAGKDRDADLLLRLFGQPPAPAPLPPDDAAALRFFQSLEPAVRKAMLTLLRAQADPRFRHGLSPLEK